MYNFSSQVGNIRVITALRLFLERVYSVFINYFSPPPFEALFFLNNYSLVN